MNHNRRLTTKAIDTFRTIYEKKYGKCLSDEEAEALAIGLLGLILLIVEPNETTGSAGPPSDVPA